MAQTQKKHLLRQELYRHNRMSDSRGIEKYNSIFCALGPSNMIKKAPNCFHFETQQENKNWRAH